MGKYRIKDNITGKSIVVSGDSAPTEQEAAAYLAQAFPKPVGVKNYENVEKRIQDRKGAYESFNEELNKKQNPFKNPLAAAVQPLVLGIKGINTVVQPPISAIANAGMAAQEDIGNIPAIGKAALQGLTQERPGNFSDVLHRANVPFSGTLGFIGEAGAMNAGTLGKAGNLGKDFAGLAKKSLQDKRYAILGKAEDAVNALKARTSSAGKDIGQLIRGPAGKTPVPMARLQTVIDNMPASVRKVVGEAPELKRVQIANAIGGVDTAVAPTVQNVNTMKKLVGDVVNDQTFKTTLGSPSAQKRVKRVYDTLSSMETRYAPTLKPLNSRYSEVIKQTEKILPKLQSSKGEILVNPIARIASGRAELGTEKLVKQLSKEVPELATLLKSARGYARKQAVERFIAAIGRSGASGIGAYGAVRAANPSGNR